MLLVLGLSACSTAADSTVDARSVPSLSKADLERAKLAAEIRATEAKTSREDSFPTRLLQWAPFITALVAAAGVLLTLRAQRKDRMLERQRRHDEELARVVQNLGAESDRVRLNAAAALRAFLGPDGPDLQLDLLEVIVANLKIERSAKVSDMLAGDLRIALQACESSKMRLRELDLSRTSGVGLNLSGMKLRDVPIDLGFANLRWANLTGLVAPRVVRGYAVELGSARLSRANLHEARLNRARCTDAKFHAAQLVSATFRGADLERVQLQQARLQSAHFENANLLGADFTQADVADAWFCDSHGANAARLDSRALRTLALARNWRTAHLAPPHRVALQAYSGDHGAFLGYAAWLIRIGEADEAEKWFQRLHTSGARMDPSAVQALARALGHDAERAARWRDVADNLATV